MLARGVVAAAAPVTTGARWPVDGAAHAPPFVIKDMPMPFTLVGLSRSALARDESQLDE